MTSTATVHASDTGFLTVVINFIIMNWWWLWIPLFGIIGWCGDQIYDAVHSHREYRLKLAKEMRKAAQAQAHATTPAAVSRPQARPVRSPCRSADHPTQRQRQRTRGVAMQVW